MLVLFNATLFVWKCAAWTFFKISSKVQKSHWFAVKRGWINNTYFLINKYYLWGTIWGRPGLMVRESNSQPFVVSSSLRSGRNCRWGSECTALSSPSIPRLRCPWARHRTPNCSPGAATLAAHCSGCVFTVCVCSLLCVCTLDGLNAEHKFRVWVTILGRMSRHFHFHFHFK